VEHPPVEETTNRSVAVKTAEEMPLQSPSKPPASSPRPNPTTPLPMRLNSGLAPDAHSSVKNHVLLVDDNSINLQLLTMFMKKIGLSFAKASDGLQALQEYQKHAEAVTIAVVTDNKENGAAEPVTSTPDDTTSNGSRSSSTSKGSINGSNGLNGSSESLPPFTWVLMDLSMPVMDGLESTRRIRAYEREHKMKKAVVVALTGLASADAQQDALDAGVDFYLAKPVRFADLKKLMEV
jgi:CheY-like chemotaxis protein